MSIHLENLPMVSPASLLRMRPVLALVLLFVAGCEAPAGATAEDGGTARHDVDRSGAAEREIAPAYDDESDRGACVTSTDCPEGGALVCRFEAELGYKACLPPGELRETCTSDAPCASGLACRDGACLALNGHECGDNSDCVPPEVCVPTSVGAATSWCGPRSSAGGPCDQDQDCLNHRCGAASFACAVGEGHPCLADADCDDMTDVPLVCRPTGNDARECRRPGKACEPCDPGSGDCAGGATCGDNGYCKAQADEGCIGDACCPDGLLCYDARGAGPVCAPQQASAGETCQSDEHCAPGMICQQNVCVVVSDEYQCVARGDCGAGLVCLAGTCSSPGIDGSPCLGPDGLPGDDLCAPPLACNFSTGRCTQLHSGRIGDPCGRSIECGATPSGANDLVCHPQARVCAIPGPAIFAYVTSEKYTVRAAGDSFGPPECFAPPKVKDIPPDYVVLDLVDSVSIISFGEDDALGRVFQRPGTGDVCASARGQRDGFLFLDDGPPVELSFRINRLVYNPSLLDIRTHDPAAPDCPADAYGSPEDSVGQPCLVAGEYYHTEQIRDGFEGGIGLMEFRMYAGNGSDSFFAGTVVSLDQITQLLDQSIGIDVTRWMVFALTWNYSCGGPVGFRFHTISWRKGLTAHLQLGRYVEPIVMPGAEIDYSKADGTGVAFNFVGIQSYNLNNKVVREDAFWKYCGILAPGLPSEKPACDPPYESTAFPYQDQIEDKLGQLAAEGATKLCETYAPAVISDICSVAGFGADKIVELIFDALFASACGDSDPVDSDSDFRVDKLTYEDGGVAGTFDMCTYDFWGDGETGDDHSHLTVQVVLLSFTEP